MAAEPCRQSDEGNAANELLEPTANSTKTKRKAEIAGSSVDGERNCHTTEVTQNTISELNTVGKLSLGAVNGTEAANNTGKLHVFRPEICLILIKLIT